jgi:hypothetical protein
MFDDDDVCVCVCVCVRVRNNRHLDGLQVLQQRLGLEVGAPHEHVKVAGFVQAVLHLSTLEVLDRLRSGIRGGGCWERHGHMGVHGRGGHSRLNGLVLWGL